MVELEAIPRTALLEGNTVTGSEHHIKLSKVLIDGLMILSGVM
jgi:hypothetical protein